MLYNRYIWCKALAVCRTRILLSIFSITDSNLPKLKTLSNQTKSDQSNNLKPYIRLVSVRFPAFTQTKSPNLCSLHSIRMHYVGYRHRHRCLLPLPSLCTIISELNYIYNIHEHTHLKKKRSKCVQTHHTCIGIHVHVRIQTELHSIANL